MNPWIAEHLLQAELQERNDINDEYESAARKTRQTEGWISGYAIKTKRFSSKDKNADIDNIEDKNVISNNVNHEEDDIARETPQDQNDCEDDTMCAICLLSIEDDERIADLNCGHAYHAECLGEWILKKVSLI